MVDTQFWPTNFMALYPDGYWAYAQTSTGGGGAAPEYRVYKKIVASPIWGGAWR